MNPAAETGVSSSILQIVQVLAGLGVVLLVAWFALRFGLARMSGFRSTAGGPVDVVARYGLEPRRMLYLVRAGCQVVLIGTSETGIHYLTALEAQNAESILDNPAVAPDGPRFSKLIRATLRKKEGGE